MLRSSVDETLRRLTGNFKERYLRIFKSPVLTDFEIACIKLYTKQAKVTVATCYNHLKTTTMENSAANCMILQ